MNANVVERVAERMEELEAKLALCESVLRDVKSLARAALVDVATAAPLDAKAVHAALTRDAKTMTSPENVAAVLKALRKLGAGTDQAATLNSISTRIASAQQALKITDDAEHKTGHERDDAELLAWAAGLGGAQFLEPAAQLRFFAARRRQTLREHGEALLRLNAADPTLASANEPEAI